MKHLPLFLLPFGAFTSLSTAVTATEDPVLELAPMEVVATATRTERDRQSLPVRVSVIGAEELAASGAVTLGDTLRDEAAITVEAGGNFGPARTAPALRGASPNATLILVDGRRLAGEVGNPFEMGRLPTAALERIEIVEGPLATLYGADAIGGVIQLLTISPPEEESGPTGTISTLFGSSFEGEAARTSGALTLQGRAGALGYSFYLSADDTAPYERNETGIVLVKGPAGNVPPSAHPVPVIGANIASSYTVDASYRDAANVFSAGGKLAYTVAPWLTLQADFSAFEEDRDGRYLGRFHPSAYPTPAGGFWPVFNIPVHSVDDNRRLDYGLSAEFIASEALSILLRTYRSDYRKRNVTTTLAWEDLGYASEEASASSGGGNADVVIDSYEAVVFWKPGAGHEIVAGADYRDENRVGSLFNTAGTPEERVVDYTAVYLQDVWDLNETVSLLGGVRHDAIGDDIEEDTARLGVRVRLHPLLQLKAHWAQGFRAPDIRELYINRQTPAGLYQGSTVDNAAVGKTAHALNPELSNTYEVGLSGAADGWSYDVSIFRNEMTDRIEERIEAPVGTAYRTFRNVSEARIDGVELTLRKRLTGSLRLELSGIRYETENRETGADLTFVPRQSLILRLDWQATDALNLAARVRHVGSQAYETGSTARTDDWTTVSLDFNYRIDAAGAWRAHLGFDNLFDAEIDPLLGADPGPSVRGGLRFHF